MRIRLLGVPIDTLTNQEVEHKIADFLVKKVGRAVFTPNPEMLVRARKNQSFCDTLQKGDLNIPDGVGLLWAASLFGLKIPERVTGTDLMDVVCRLAAERGRTVYFLGGEDGVASRAARRMQDRHPTLKVVGALGGGRVSINADGEPLLSPEVEKSILITAPDVLLVAFGHEIQERWIASHLQKFFSVRVAMGIGGAFDFWAGDVSRAPRWVQKIWLEWCWRLILQPRRIGRILTAVILFPALVLGVRLGIIKAESNKL
ncbi:hypothetical protein A2480_03865 [Candidatus Uhrbacteria bacterium RIFOXYC2_FULL_47_19]|uniref:Glycosyltransferase n=1 Tax=Candidatus Uhrbacteria bacterium RIFOXYC2_FULL_47_19 TaxID=1802424 RepID=A0A1F7WC51_9BACT|nr:MAG: hypothetical protein A2480_03865 [Candidatus Uhrbacteria bacterium RIFOXYC2_FULL_47_19]HCC21775.1 hypothetical protein [Candidatus Uhrbacteria bacterium]